jgi:hypothetical protein
MSEVYRDSELIGMAIDTATAQARSAAAGAEQTRSGLRAEASEVRHKIERYVTAFESGALAASAFGGRVGALQAQLDVLDGRLQETGRPTPEPVGSVDAAIVSWALSEALGAVLRGTSVATTKALLRVLVEEIRVFSPEDIRPTYRVLMSVRTPNEVVGEGGFEPPTWRV